MRKNLGAYRTCQVFLNYPYDEQFSPLADALTFAVVAGGLLPLTARDLTSPDVPRLSSLIEAIQHSHYSAHDLSRFVGEGPRNLARMNMPIEMGMALYHALQNQLADHRCAFFVPTAHDYRTFASDLAGLDPRSHENRPEVLVAEMYDWLRSVVPHQLFNSQPTVEVVEKFAEFRGRLDRVHGSTDGRRPSHNETREVMYLVCSECGWWDWRETRLGREEFQSVPIAWRRDEKPDRTLLNGA